MKMKRKMRNSIQQENDSLKKTKNKASHQLSMPNGYVVDDDDPIYSSSEESAEEIGLSMPNGYVVVEDDDPIYSSSEESAEEIGLSMPNGYVVVDDDDPIYSSSEESSEEIGPHISPEEQDQINKDGRLQNEQCAKTALEYYNKKNRTNYELVDVGSSAGFLYDGIQYHCNFKAKRKLSSPDNGDCSAKLFFAELYSASDEPFTKHVVGCRIIKGKTASCELCRGDIQHPSHGFRIRYRTNYNLRSRPCYMDY